MAARPEKKAGGEFSSWAQTSKRRDDIARKEFCCGRRIEKIWNEEYRKRFDSGSAASSFFYILPSALFNRNQHLRE
jgi:hypothetical protein